ncbi:C-module-binding factor A [Contarinia nasturtii]|uniref:C-module-binding factor A n=1 Tax=Contarinia nasturtii TaxID=265458 RepID=UPI0012D3C6C3|nr:C-module-binding factor A [Contarinia nasturtii]XP_031634241.1 C-module-binding factor A [Contarinia nasturtii]XP_031634242.1 C-module-binding factor A [Contarinia nasturtii]
MTNSHNRATQKEGRNSERNNASPNHQKNGNQNGNGRKVTFFNDNQKGGKGYYAQKHSSSAPQYFSTSPKDIVMPANSNNHAKNHHHRHHHNNTNNNHQQQHQRNHHNGSPHGILGRSPPRSPISFASPAGVSTTTPNLHFAGSKYFDAPSPNALPRPPSNWTTTNSQMIEMSLSPPTTTSSMADLMAQSKRRLFPLNDAASDKKCSLMVAEAASKNLCSDIFSHNLKLLLNVQA